MRLYELASLVHWPPRRDAIARALRDLAPRRVIDVGAGTGLLAPLAAAMDIEYLGLEPDRGMLAQARTRGGPRITFAQGGAGALRCSIRAGDVTVLNGVAHHLEDAELADVVEAAASGHALIICDHYRAPGALSRVARWLQDHDRGRFVRDYGRFEELPGYRLIREELFPIPSARLPLWPYFCNSYRPMTCDTSG